MNDEHFPGPTPLPSDTAVWTAFHLALIVFLILAAGVVYYTTGVAG